MHWGPVVAIHHWINDDQDDSRYRVSVGLILNITSFDVLSRDIGCIFRQPLFIVDPLCITVNFLCIVPGPLSKYTHNEKWHNVCITSFLTGQDLAWSIWDTDWKYIKILVFLLRYPWPVYININIRFFHTREIYFQHCSEEIAIM